MRNDFLDDAFANTDLMHEAVYVNAAGVRKEIKVDFIRENSEITVGVVGIQSGKPTARARSADVQPVDNTCTLTIDGVLYHVADNNDDADGQTLLVLSLDPTR